MNELFRRHCFRQGSIKIVITTNDRKFCSIAIKKDIGAGTTAVTALVYTDKIIIANTGDSRAVMVRRSGASAITEDHNPGLHS